MEGCREGWIKGRSEGVEGTRGGCLDRHNWKVETVDKGTVVFRGGELEVEV